MPDFSTADSDNRDIYEAVSYVRSPGQSPPKDGLEVFTVILARYEKLLKDERELQDGLSALQLEGNFVRTEAARVTKPEGLRLAAGAFGVSDGGRRHGSHSRSRLAARSIRHPLAYRAGLPVHDRVARFRGVSDLGYPAAI